MKLQREKGLVFKVVKISLGCVISMIISNIIGLSYSTSAGLITILSIQDTKKETFITALKRLIAFVLAMVISVICFNLIGFNKYAFGLYVFIFFIICSLVDLKSAMVPISVLVTHIMGEGNSSWSLILNEFLVFFIGAGIAILMNMHLRQDKLQMKQAIVMMDDKIRDILARMSRKVTENDKEDYNGECFKKLDFLIFEAQKIAEINSKNVLKVKDPYDLHYVQMRKRQCRTLYEMYKLIRLIEITPEQANLISAFLAKVAHEYHEENDGKSLLSELEILFNTMKSQKLPSERKEFESRALLFNLMIKIRELIEIKREFIG